MKTLIIIAAAAALAGCATAPGPQYGYGAPADPSQWHVVSVTPVPPGTGARVAANSPDGSRVEYSSTPITATAPVYLPPPVYAPQPSYYYPPVSLSLGFVFGRHWSSGRHHRGHHHGRRHR